MLEKEKLDRINALARKNRETGLTEAELAERELLRKEYLTNFRAHFKQRLEDIKYVEDLTEEERRAYENKN